MRRLSTIVFLGAVASFGPVAIAQPSVPLDAALKAPAAVVDGFHHALQAGDAAAARAAMAPDALIFESGGVERGVAEYAAHHLASDMAFAKETKRTVLKRSGVAQGDVAWITTEGITTGSYKGKAIHSRSLETMVLKRDAEGWRVAHIHWSSGNIR